MKKKSVATLIVVLIFVIGVLIYNKLYMPFDKSKGMYKILNGKHFTYYSFTKDNKDKIKELDKYIESEYDYLTNKFGVVNVPNINVSIFENSEKLSNATV